MPDLDFRQMPEWMPDALEIQALVNTWARAYDVSPEAIKRQIPIAYGWAVSNKNKAPKKNVIRYLFNFMRKAKEFGNLVEKSIDRTYHETLPEEEMSVEEMKAIREKNMGNFHVPPHQ